MTLLVALRCLRLDAHRHPPQADAHAVVPRSAKVLRGPRRPDAVPLRRRAAWACPSSPEKTDAASPEHRRPARPPGTAQDRGQVHRRAPPGPGRKPPGPFTLGQLLTACGTAPDWTGENPVVAPEWAPEMFVFTPLGGPVPYSAVLLLLGLLAPTSRSTELELESRNGFHSLIVACSGRRFEMVLSQDDYVTERCRVPGCELRPVSAHSIPYCALRHLAARSEDELVEMATGWGTPSVRSSASRTPPPCRWARRATS